MASLFDTSSHLNVLQIQFLISAWTAMLLSYIYFIFHFIPAPLCACIVFSKLLLIPFTSVL